MNNKGFTMIELLASMVLLSVLMLTAVPTVLKTMDNSRKTTIVSDAKKLVANVEYKLKNNNNYVKRPKAPNQCILMTLGYLDLGTDFQEGPHGGLYAADQSYVVIKLVSTNPQKYDFYVTLVENYDDDAYYGLYLVSYTNLVARNAKDKVDGFNTSKLLSSSGLTGSKRSALGCTNDLKNSSSRTSDTIYDSDDALREMGAND